MRQHHDERTTRLLAFQTKYRALRARFITLRQHFYRLACAWCQRRLGWKRQQAAVPGETRQSIGSRYAADTVRTFAHAYDFADADGSLRRREGTISHAADSQALYRTIV